MRYLRACGILVLSVALASGVALAAESGDAPEFSRNLDGAALSPSRIEQMIQRHELLHQQIAQQRQGQELAGLPAVTTLGSLAQPLTSPQDPAEPVPIPGGLFPGVHTWVPGPTALGLQGEGVDPNTITHFQGFSAIAYIAGLATGSDGNLYEMFHDMRVYRGNYIAADGKVHRGTFAFI
jgi:hypothetical protein